MRDTNHEPGHGFRFAHLVVTRAGALLHRRTRQGLRRTSGSKEAREEKGMIHLVVHGPSGSQKVTLKAKCPTTKWITAQNTSRQALAQLMKARPPRPSKWAKCRKKPEDNGRWDFFEFESKPVFLWGGRRAKKMGVGSFIILRFVPVRWRSTIVSKI